MYSVCSLPHSHLGKDVPVRENRESDTGGQLLKADKGLRGCCDGLPVLFDMIHPKETFYFFSLSAFFPFFPPWGGKDLFTLRNYEYAEKMA